MVKNEVFLSLVAIVLPLINVDGYRILAAFPFASRSHTHIYYSLTSEMARLGHEVVVITPYPLKKPVPNQTEIFVPFMQENQDKHMGQEPWEIKKTPILQSLSNIQSVSKQACKNGLKMPEIQQLMKSKEKFDLFMYGIYYNECVLGLAYLFQVPIIGMSPNAASLWANDVVGNPELYSFIPNLMLPFSDKMTFTQRLINTVTGVSSRLLRHYFILPEHEDIAKTIYGDQLPSVSEIERNVSLVFVNSQVALNFPRPLVPNMIEVGGLHVKPAGKLPQDLQEFLDEAKDGAIFFSLGSAVRSDRMPAEKKKIFLELFAELPQKILWKYESDSLLGLPKNIKLAKWLPQQDVLGHPNVKLFITQGGLLSLQEAVYHGVPVLGIPIYLDQDRNMIRAVEAGFGEKIAIETLTKETLRDAIMRLLNDKSYKENVQRLSAIFKDQPEPPLERAVFWTEYVIRHKGARHLRVAAMDLSWYQYFLLDVVAFLLVTVILVLAIVFVSIRATFRVLRRNNNKLKLN